MYKTQMGFTEAGHCIRYSFLRNEWELVILDQYILINRSFIDKLSLEQKHLC